MKVKIDNMQQNNKCKSCEEKVHHIISKCNKQAQKEYKTRHDSVGRVIHWELCKRLKFDQIVGAQTRTCPWNLDS